MSEPGSIQLSDIALNECLDDSQRLVFLLKFVAVRQRKGKPFRRHRLNVDILACLIPSSDAFEFNPRSLLDELIKRQNE